MVCGLTFNTGVFIGWRGGSVHHAQHADGGLRTRGPRPDRPDGAYDFELKWAPLPDPNSDNVSIFTAVQEQLGLRLESGTAPLDVLVIDRIERPSEN